MSDAKKISQAELEACVHADSPSSCFINIKVQPGAKTEALAGLYDKDQIKVLLRAPPVDGEANESLCDFIGELLGLRSSAVSIVYGHKNRSKRVLVAMSREQVITTFLTIS